MLNSIVRDAFVTSVTCRLALRQPPDQPAVHSAEAKLTTLRTRTNTLHLVQNPAQLAPRKVRIRQQASLRLDRHLMPIAAQLLTKLRRPPVLPHNRVVHRLARSAVPDQRRLPLFTMPTAAISLASRPACASASAATPICVDQISIGSCSTQPGSGKIWAKLRCAVATTPPALINHQGPRTGRPLIESQNVPSLCHAHPFSRHHGPAAQPTLAARQSRGQRGPEPPSSSSATRASKTSRPFLYASRSLQNYAHTRQDSLSSKAAL